jgi:hypothetical protein
MNSANVLNPSSQTFQVSLMFSFVVITPFCHFINVQSFSEFDKSFGYEMIGSARCIVTPSECFSSFLPLFIGQHIFRSC